MGKHNRKRLCPAAGQEIERYECAAGRHTKYQCPESCPHNPFSADRYQDFLLLERRADEHFINWLRRGGKDLSALAELMSGFGTSAEPQAAYFHRICREGIYRTGTGGSRAYDAWVDSFSAADTDTRFVLAARKRMAPCVIEVQYVLDEVRTRAIDLLDPSGTPFLIADRSLARHAGRFFVYAGHLYPLPHFCRLFGTAIRIPSFGRLAMGEAIRLLLEHLGGPAAAEHPKVWLGENFELFERALRSSAIARRKAMMENVDAYFGKALYKLNASPEAATAALARHPDLRPDRLSEDERREGFSSATCVYARDTDEERRTAGPDAVLGRILVGPLYMRLEAMGGARLDKLRGRFEEYMGSLVQFEAERRDNLARRLALSEPGHDPQLVPPKLVENVPQLATGVSRVAVPEGVSPEQVAAAARKNADRRFLDEPLPGLRGASPRAAVSDPELRSILITMMKERVAMADEQSLERGVAEDPTWMLEELGLKEICFPPPLAFRRGA